MITDNLATFVISICFALAGFWLTIVGKYQKNFDKLDEKIKKKKITLLKIKQWVTAICFIACGIGAFVEFIQNNKKANQQNERIIALSVHDTLNTKNIDSLKRELKIAQKAIVDTVGHCGYNTLAQIHVTEEGMAKKFAEYIKTDKEEHRKTRDRVDSVQGKPEPLITLLPGYNCGVEFVREGNVVTIGVFIKNSGNGIAYTVNADWIVLCDGNGSLEILGEPNMLRNHDLYANLMTKITVKEVFIDSVCAKNKRVFVNIIKGYYFTDYLRKNKREFYFSHAYQVTENTCSPIDKEDVDKFFNASTVKIWPPYQ